MYGGSWDITSQCIIKTLCGAVAAVAPTPKPAPHHKWMETSIGFNAFDCLKNMATIVNGRQYHVLVDGGAALNLISLVAFEKL
jgi:hypothetical protein